MVDEFLAVLVDNKHLPLRIRSARAGGEGKGERASPRVVLRIVLRMTVACVSNAADGRHAQRRRACVRSRWMSIMEMLMVAGSTGQ